jgi:phenylpyruvate tautomerase PptA (4-oxalocrotonate tautomerase family)
MNTIWDGERCPIIVELVPGRSEEQEVRLAERIVHDVVTTPRSDEPAMSVAIQEVKPGDWIERPTRRTSSPTGTTCKKAG